MRPGTIIGEGRTGRGRAARRPLAFRLAAMALGILFAALAAEVALRLTWGALPLSLRAAAERRYGADAGGFDATVWMRDPELGLRPRPDLDAVVTDNLDTGPFDVRTNSLGLRDDRPPASLDIVALGDSFTFGYGVAEEQSWVARLEERSGRDTLNLGFVGWCPAQYPLALERLAAGRRPRLVLWSFFVNDLWENAEYVRWRAAGFPADPPGQGAASRRAGPSLTGRSRLGQAVSVALAPAELSRRDLPFEPRLIRDDRLDLHYVPDWFLRATSDDPDIAEGWRLTEAALARTRRDLGARRLVVIYVPFKEQVYWHHLKDHLDEPAAYRFERIRATLADIADRQGVPLIDLTEPMRTAAERGARLYFTDDGHWNAEGHELAAALIDAALARIAGASPGLVAGGPDPGPDPVER